MKIKENKKVDRFHRHEVIDRCMFLCDIIEDGIIGHPALSKEMSERLKEAQSLIYKVGCRASGPHCKKCGITALIPAVVKKKKRDVCLNCFHSQKREKLSK